MNKVVLFFLLASSFAINAQELTLKKINTTRTKFSATFTDAAAIQIGQVYEMKDDFDQSCIAKVTSKKETWVVLDIGGTCVIRDDLKDGNKFVLNPTAVFEAAPVAAPAPAAPTATPAPENAEVGHWQFGAGLGYQLSAPDARFDNAEYYSTGTGSIKGEGRLRYKPAFTIAFEGRFLPRKAWGFIGGIQIEGEREFDTGFLRGGGIEVTLSGGSGSSKVQFTTLYASAVYRWNDFYLPFGINISTVKFKPAGGYTGTVSSTSGWGGQLGVGWRFSDLFVLEAYSWVAAFKLRTSNSTETLDYGVGNFPTLVLIGKFTF